MGVFVALVALLATASAQSETKAETKKAAPAKKAPAKSDPKSGKETAKAADAPAENPDAEGSAEPEPTLEEIEAQLPPHQTGPKLVDLGNDIEVDLPAGMILFEHAEAKAILEKFGDHAENVNAIILKRDQLNQDAAWEVIIEYDDVGYVTDHDADELDANELLQSYKQGTEQQNIERRAKGIPDLIVDGWSEMPKYEKANHHLKWGLNAHTTEGPTINFFTRVLGRNGYMSVNLIDSPDRIEASKLETTPLLNATRFKKGATYEDHEGDKSSGMGLRALVIGGTGLAVMKVAKTGLLIKLLLVFKKGFIVLFAAIGGFFKWLFGRGKKIEGEPVSYETPPSDDSSST